MKDGNKSSGRIAGILLAGALATGAVAAANAQMGPPGPPAVGIMEATKRPITESNQFPGARRPPIVSRPRSPSFSAWPLVVATGAAQISRRAVGTAVFGGMLAASSIGIFLVPMLYVTFQRWREAALRPQ